MTAQGSKRRSGNAAGLPAPSPGRGGGLKLVLMAAVAVIAVACAAFWLTREPGEREQWRDEAAKIIDNATSGTPLQGMGSILRREPPPLPDFVIRPPTSPGTMAGRSIQGQVAGSGEPAGAGGADRAGGAPGEPAARAGDAVLPTEEPVREDSRIRGGFVEDLADYLVSRYRPGPHGGSLAVSVQGLNQRYGHKLGEAQRGGRASLMRYAFHPAMIGGLYNLYVNRFMEDLQNAAARRRLTPQQASQMRRHIAGGAVMLAGALDSIAAMPDLAQHMEREEKLAAEAGRLNAQMATAVFETDEMRENGATATQLAAAKMRVDGLAARYRRAMNDQEKATRALVAAIRKGAGQGLDDDTLLFLARWVQRRLAADGQAAASVRSAAAVLRDLARRCTIQGGPTPGQNPGRPLTEQ